MFYGIRHLRDAVAKLGEPGGGLPPRDDLAEAFRGVWRATTYWQLWPTEVQSRANDLFELLLRYGALADTAVKMTDDEVRGAVAVLRGFLAEAETLDRAGTPAAP